MKRECIICGKEFDSKHSRQKTCGKECSNEYIKILKKEYVLNNKDKIKESAKKYRLEHKKSKIKNCIICNNAFVCTNNSKTCGKECSRKNRNINANRNSKKYIERHPEKRKETSYKYYMKNKEVINKRIQSWKEKNPEKIVRIVNKWRKNNKVKRNAQANAQRKIPIPTNELCNICGKEMAKHRHHLDYNNPLDVIFLCTQCHYNIHHNKLFNL
jgi:hypothetical protein